MFLLRSTLRFPISLTNRRAVGNVSLIEIQRNEGTSSVIPSMPRVASWEDDSDWLNLEICGATGECPRIARRRNGIRDRDSRRHGRVFSALQPRNCVACHLSQGMCRQRKCLEMKTHTFYIVNAILLFYFILFYFILFYFILFYFILFYFILFYFILFYFILFTEARRTSWLVAPNCRVVMS